PRTRPRRGPAGHHRRRVTPRPGSPPPTTSTRFLPPRLVGVVVAAHRSSVLTSRDVPNWAVWLRNNRTCSELEESHGARKDHGIGGEAARAGLGGTAGIAEGA